MARNEDIGISNTFGGRKHGVERTDCSPIGKEMTLIVMCPWVIAKIVLIIDSLWKSEFIGGGVGDDTGIGETRDGDLTFFQLSA